MVNAAVLRQFVPLSALPSDARAELARDARVGNYRKGQTVFVRGEDAATAVYLLSGTVELLTDAGTHKVKAGSEEAKQALSRGGRRAATCTCLSDAQVAFLDRDRLDLALTWTQSGGVEVVELEASGDEEEIDWMTAMLTNPVLHRIPPGNIPRIFAAMQPVEFAAGETLIREGEPGDWYYVLTQGQVRVVRGGRAVVALGPGRAFGEEALVSGDPRNATVQALTAGHAMRLSAQAFEQLLKAPLFREVSVEDVPDTAQLIDVRLPDEFRNGRLPGAISLPLAQLRDEVGKLASDREYVVYCDSGRRSAAATYLLSERGFDARLLTGGIPADEMPVRG